MNGGNGFPRGFCFTVSSSGSVFADSTSDLEFEFELTVPRTGEAWSTHGEIADPCQPTEIGELSSVLFGGVYQEKGWLSVLTP